MILRQRKKHTVLEKLEVWSNLLMPDNPELPKIEREVAQWQAGYKGELRLDYFLRYLPQTYSILNDVTLVLDHVKTQFDSIIISNQAIYLIEVKNRSEEHTSELQSRFDLVCRLLLEKKKTIS